MLRSQNMIARILISSSLQSRAEEIEKILFKEQLKSNHPDVLFFEDGEKLGVESAKKIREHLSLKPYQAKGRAVAVISAQDFTPEAQNSLLKTLEEPPAQAIILLAASTESNFLPTILSRCRIIKIQASKLISGREVSGFEEDIANLNTQTIEERFQYIEKLEEKEKFLKALVSYYREDLKNNPKNLIFTKLLLDAEEWENANVNIRAILEFLMLNLPKK
jgi:DNA polymerase III delta prime subunit